MALVRCTMIAIGIFAVHAGAAFAEDAPRLRALQTCPATSDGAACVEMMMHWDFARTDRPRFVASAEKGARVIAVRGRLNKGRLRAFELVVKPRDATHENDLGEVAYLGRSRAWRPVILTDQGALAIDTRGVHVGRAQGVAIIDEKARKVVASYLSGLSGGTYIVRGVDDTVVLSKGGACLSPPPSQPGTLVRASGCDQDAAPSKTLQFSERIVGDVKPADDADLDLIRALLPQARDLSDAQLGARVGRIGPHHLIVTPWASVELVDQ